MTEISVDVGGWQEPPVVLVRRDEWDRLRSSNDCRVCVEAREGSVDPSRWGLCPEHADLQERSLLATQALADKRIMEAHRLAEARRVAEAERDAAVARTRVLEEQNSVQAEEITRWRSTMGYTDADEEVVEAPQAEAQRVPQAPTYQTLGVLRDAVISRCSICACLTDDGEGHDRWHRC